MDALRKSIFWGLSAAIVAACSSTVELGPVPDTGVEPMTMGDAGTMRMPDPDAGQPDAATMMPIDDCPCGLCFERRAEPEYTDLWVRSPTDIWLALDGRRIERFDGVTYTDVPLPELDSELERILALDGGDGEHPFLALSRRRSTSGRIYELFRWTGADWDSVPLPVPLQQSLNGTLLIAPTEGGHTWAALRGESSEPAVATVFSFDGSGWSEHSFEGAWRVYAVRANTERAFVTLLSDDRSIALWESRDGGWHPFPTPDYLPEWGTQVPRIAIGTRLYALSGFVHVWDPESSRWLLLEGLSAAGAGTTTTGEWLIGRQFTYRFDDPADPLSYETHRLPFRGGLAAFPSDGPAWAAGGGLAYWSGSQWQSVSRGSRLYAQSSRGAGRTPVWGVAGDDYWVVDRINRAGVHVHDHIAQYVDLDGPFFSSVHGVSADDVFFLSARAVHRVVDHVLVERHDIVDAWSVSGSTRLWGPDEEHLWLSTPNGIYRYREGEFVEELAPDAEHWAGVPTFVGGRSETDVWAISGSGAVYRYDGSNWRAMPDIPMNAAGSDPSQLREAYVGATGVWALTATYHSADEESLHAWSFRSGAWERTALYERQPRTEHDMFGRGDEVWVLTHDRVLYRRSDGDSWQRDERCHEAGPLSDIAFATGWFPPDGAPPKIFGRHGNVLVAQEPE